MGFWASFRRAARGATDVVQRPEREAPPPEAIPLLVARLLAFGEAGGPSEAESLPLFEAARASPYEGRVLDHLVQVSARAPLPPRLTLTVASALRDRGDKAAAGRLLSASDATDALLLRADLLAEEGDFASAVAMIERALSKDFDLPGAIERRRFWRSRLGLGEERPRKDPATMTVAAPKTRAPFDLVREVARGGAGVVYAAIDRELGRTVALKMVHQPDRDRAQLLHEARVAAALEGPGVVRVFDVEPEAGWLALEWAPMGSLRDVLRAPTAEGLPLLADGLPDLARALARVHAAGWVHNDVKPANVLLATAGEPWLGDFGIARHPGEPSPPGSLGYVSPERLAGRASDPRDDVYAIGRVFEDVLGALGEVTDAARWREIAARCVGPSETRPGEGAAVVALIDELLRRCREDG